MMMGEDREKAEIGEERSWISAGDAYRPICPIRGYDLPDASTQLLASGGYAGKHMVLGGQ